MHRRLAELLSEPEQHARHLALSDSAGEPRTLEALNTAARMARWRGAPRAAADFLDLAIRLGDDTPKLRIRSARNHLDAGDSARAQTLLRALIAELPPGIMRAEALNTLAVVDLYGDSFVEAAELLERALEEVGDHLPLRVQTLVTLSFTLLNLGDITAGLTIGEQALTEAERLGHPALLSQALSLRAHLWFRRGHGLDRPSLQRALQLEDRDARMPAALRPSVQNALLLAWSGELGQGYDEMAVWRRRCIEHGEENELVHVVFNMFQIEIWRGNFAEAKQLADDAMESAIQVGGDLALGTALTMRAAIAAYVGDESAARANAVAAQAASQRCGAQILGRWPIESLAFLDLSMGDHAAALNTLAPLLSVLNATPDATEISVAGFVPDAVEALIGVGRTDEAAPLIDALESKERDWIARGCWPPAPAAGRCCSPHEETSRQPWPPRKRRWPNTTACQCHSNALAHSWSWENFIGANAAGRMPPRPCVVPKRCSSHLARLYGRRVPEHRWTEFVWARATPAY
jgi:tetratricopeptide (TPR) repeat protein